MQKIGLHLLSALFFLTAFARFLQADDEIPSLSPIVEYLVTVSERHQLNPESPVPIVAIGGCPGVGKTYLTKNLLTVLQSKGVKCAVLPLDDFNLSAEDRKKIGTEWDIRHFKVSELHSTLSSIHQGAKLVSKPTYSQITGLVGFQTLDITDIDLILFEGLYALCTREPINFYNYCTTGIFIEADEADIYRWKWEREQKKMRSRTPEQFEYHMQVLLTEYYTNIAYSKGNALFLIKKDTLHNYQIVSE